MGTHSELISVGTPLVGAGAPASSEAWQAAFAAALPYQEFLARHGTTDQRARWDAFHARVTLTSEQGKLLAGFVRRMPAGSPPSAGSWPRTGRPRRPAHQKGTACLQRRRHTSS